MTSTTTCSHDNPVFAEASSTFFAFGSTTCTTVQDASSTGALYLNGFTYGEVWIGFLLLGMFLMQFFGGIINQVAGLKGRARNTRNPNIK